MLVAICAGLSAVTSGSAFAQNVTNGSFEAVQIGPPFVSTNPADIPGWTHTGTVGDGLLWAVGYSDPDGSVTVAGDGKQFVTLGGGIGVAGSASWTTKITGLTVGDTYDLNFKIANQGPLPPEGNIGLQVMTVGFSDGSSTGPSMFTAPTNGVGLPYWRFWLSETLPFAATATSVDVVFSVTNQAADMGLDSVSVPVPVPEPSTWAMLALGFAGLGLLAHRARAKAAVPA
jgi:hypothetical protein